MVFVSLTRLKIRSVRFLPAFAFHTMRSISQVRRSAGFLDGALLTQQTWIFWTLTAWESEESMRRYMLAGSHKRAMPHLLDWCDEASVAHWEQQDATLPSWAEAERRMRETGRASKVRHPSAGHATLNFGTPRALGGGPIRRSGG